jgi:hypothetical protein
MRRKSPKRKDERHMSSQEKRLKEITAAAVTFAGDITRLQSTARHELHKYLKYAGEDTLNDYERMAVKMADDRPEMWALLWFLCLQIHNLEEQIDILLRKK